jgi:hypothetical protein
MPALVISIFFMLVAGLANVANTAALSTTSNRLERQKLAQTVVAQAVRQYAKETGSYPITLSAMTLVPGYGYLKTYVSKPNGGFFPSTRDAVELTVSAPITGLAWTYSRAVVYSLNNRTETTASYLGAARNSCAPVTGPADFGSAQSWCPANDSKATALEQQAGGAAEMAKSQLGQNRTLAKFIAAYRVTLTFPIMSSPTTLASLVTGYNGATSASALTCQGVFAWQGIPFNCSDLFNLSGQPVSYQRIAAKHIALTSLSALADQTGAIPLLTSDAQIP